MTVERLAGVALREITYPHGDICQYLTVWFRCRPVEGEAVVTDEESTAVGWYRPAEFPDLDPVDQLRITTALDDNAPPWFALPRQTYDWLSPRS